MILFTFVNIVCTDGKVIDIYEDDRFSNRYIPEDVQTITINKLPEEDFYKDTIKFGIKVFINIVAENINEAREKELIIIRNNKENFESFMKTLKEIDEIS